MFSNRQRACFITDLKVNRHIFLLFASVSAYRDELVDNIVSTLSKEARVAVWWVEKFASNHNAVSRRYDILYFYMRIFNFSFSDLLAILHFILLLFHTNKVAKMRETRDIVKLQLCKRNEDIKLCSCAYEPHDERASNTFSQFHSLLSHMNEEKNWKM